MKTPARIGTGSGKWASSGEMARAMRSEQSPILMVEAMAMREPEAMRDMMVVTSATQVSAKTVNQAAAYMP